MLKNLIKIKYLTASVFFVALLLGIIFVSKAIVVRATSSLVSVPTETDINTINNSLDPIANLRGVQISLLLNGKRAGSVTGTYSISQPLSFDVVDESGYNIVRNISSYEWIGSDGVEVSSDNLSSTGGISKGINVKYSTAGNKYLRLVVFTSDGDMYFTPKYFFNIQAPVVATNPVFSCSADRSSVSSGSVVVFTLLNPHSASENLSTNWYFNINGSTTTPFEDSSKQIYVKVFNTSSSVNPAVDTLFVQALNSGGAVVDSASCSVNVTH